jgi:hypothetical protein
VEYVIDPEISVREFTSSSCVVANAAVLDFWYVRQIRRRMMPFGD